MLLQGASESYSRWCLRSMSNLCSRKKSAPIIGWLTSARMKVQLKFFLRPKCRDKVRLPKVGIAEPFTALRGSVTKIPFCQECALTLGDTNLWPTPGPILISPTRTFIQANLATTLSELYFLSNYSWKNI